MPTWFTSNASSASLEGWIDPRHSPEKSIVLRYRNAFRFETSDEDDEELKGWFERTSIREGARILPLLHYRGVELHVLDESSCMHTGSLKSIDGCITTARCKLRGYDRVVFESGANTGTALTEYGVRAGMETFCFVPLENLPLLSSRSFEPADAHLIAVERPGQVKRAAHLFAKLAGLAHVPERAWRYEAARFRGCLVLEHMSSHGRFDWISQTISAGFGPVGIYQVLRGLGGEIGELPRFLGIQQEANCPMVRAWRSASSPPTPSPLDSTASLLTRVMYDATPETYGSYRDLKQVLESSGGDLSTINHEEFAAFLRADLGGHRAHELLASQGIQLPREIVETTGLIALAGTLKEIARGTIAEGSRVLCCLTSGAVRADGLARADAILGRRRTAS